MSALFKRVGIAVVALDLLVGGAAAAALHHRSASAAGGAKMSAAQLQQIVGTSAGHISCSSDPSGGWDYYCISADGSRTLYDVAADRIVQRSDLPTYR